MELREALKVLGPRRVWRGMEALESGPDFDMSLDGCFVARAFGGTLALIHVLAPEDLSGWNRLKRAIGFKPPAISQAAAICEGYYVGSETRGTRWATSGPLPPVSRSELRAMLRSECVLLLAENGYAIEPSPTSCGKPSVCVQVSA